MDELFKKISSYNLFNYLLPGILFVSVVEIVTDYSLVQDDIIIGLFVYYFIGLVISRFGSLIVEPLLKKAKFIKFASYNDFVTASKKDSKIELLSEANNMYRTIISLFILLVLLFFYNYFEYKFLIPPQLSIFILIVLIIIMFLYSYKKQTSYITKRIDANK